MRPLVAAKYWGMDYLFKEGPIEDHSTPIKTKDIERNLPRKSE